MTPQAAGAHRGAAALTAGVAAVPFPALRFKLPRLRRSSVAVPFGRRLPRLLGTGLTFAFFGAVGLTGAVFGGEYQAFRTAYGEPHHLAARMLGFGVERVTIAGIAQLTEREVLDGAGITPRSSVPFVSASEMRERLQQMPLVRTASVRKLFPNELVITLVEREPYALWQRNGELFVISADGTPIDEMQDARFADLPLVVGDEANARTKDYLALLEAAGPLKGRIKAGTLVSGRRWNLKLDNGVDVRLPELGTAAALTRLIKLEREQKILEKDVLAIDLRMADRIVLRLTEEAMAARMDGLKKKPTRGKGVET
jgi:cell division protein FtsQ